MQPWILLQARFQRRVKRQRLKSSSFILVNSGLVDVIDRAHSGLNVASRSQHVPLCYD